MAQSFFPIRTARRRRTGGRRKAPLMTIPDFMDLLFHALNRHWHLVCAAEAVVAAAGIALVIRGTVAMIREDRGDA